ncbi:hypothetical protein VTP21DRAFT_11321 [Calcarisporiella thermophila]
MLRGYWFLAGSPDDIT